MTRRPLKPTKDQVVPGAVFRVYKGQRGMYGDRVVLYRLEGGTLSVIKSLECGAVFRVQSTVLHSLSYTYGETRKIRNMVLVREEASGDVGYIQYGGIHYQCELVSGPQPPAPSLWERILET